MSKSRRSDTPAGSLDPREPSRILATMAAAATIYAQDEDQEGAAEARNGLDGDAGLAGLDRLYYLRGPWVRAAAASGWPALDAYERYTGTIRLAHALCSRVADGLLSPAFPPRCLLIHPELAGATLKINFSHHNFPILAKVWRAVLAVVGTLRPVEEIMGCSAWVDPEPVGTDENSIRGHCGKQRPKHRAEQVDRQAGHAPDESAPFRTGRPPSIDVQDRPRVMELAEELWRGGCPLKNLPVLLKERYDISITLPTLKKYRTEFLRTRRVEKGD